MVGPFGQDFPEPLFALHNVRIHNVEVRGNNHVSLMISDWEGQQYARDRKAEYDALNQFEMQFDDEANSTTTWKDAIEAIKKKHPKG